MRQDSGALGMALVACAVALAWCGVAAARVGLAPVVAEGAPPPGLERSVEAAAARALERFDFDGTSTAELARSLVLAPSAPPPTTEQCVAAGEGLLVDDIVVIRLRPGAYTVEAELRVVAVATGEEARYEVSATVQSAPGAVAGLLRSVFEKMEKWKVEVVTTELGGEELVEVNAALGRRTGRAYRKYLEDDDPEKPGFAQYLYDRAEKRRNAAIALAVVIPAVFLSATVALGVGTRGVWEDYECPPYDEEEECDYDFNQGLVVFERVLVVIGLVIGAACTIAPLAPCIFMGIRRQREMDRLRPLVTPIALRNGGGLALGLRF